MKEVLNTKNNVNLDKGNIPNSVDGNIALVAVAMTRIVQFFTRQPAPAIVQTNNLRGPLDNSQDRESILSPEMERLVTANAEELSKMAGFKDMESFVKETDSMMKAFDKIIPKGTELDNVLKENQKANSINVVDKVLEEVNQIKDKITPIIKEKRKKKKRKVGGPIKKLVKKIKREL